MFSFVDLERHTTAVVLAGVAAALPDAEAVVGMDGRATYREMAARSSALAHGLRQRGLGPGDRLGVLLPNGLRWVTATLAAHAAGISVVPLNTWSRATELKDVVGRSGLRAIVADQRIFGHDFAADLGNLGLLAETTDFLGTFFWPQGAARPEGLEPVQVEDPIATLRAAPTEETSEAYLLFTSGSTAEPKAVPLEHGGLVRNGYAVGERHHLVPGDRVWLASPLFFVAGCGNAFPNALTHAATLCVQERFEPEEALCFIEAERCTVYYGLPTMTRAMIDCGKLPDHDISSLRTGSTAFTSEDMRLAIEVLGIEQVCSAYGMTEGFGHSAMTDADDPAAVRIATQGRALSTQELRIASGDGSAAPPGETGEIQIRGGVTSGYVDAPALNTSSFVDGWFRTGDLGWLDAEDRLHFVGRSSEMMKVKGINVSPAEVEAILRQHPEVDQAFVFGLPKPHGDEAVACVLVAQPGANEDRLGDDVRAFVRERASSYKVPDLVRVLPADALPLTSTGKVSKLLLKRQMEEP